MGEIYRYPPRDISDEGIPIFCEVDDYIENYNKIAQDEVLIRGGEYVNRFIPDKEWKIMENTTMDLIATYIGTTDKKVLDLGVGMGRLLNYMEERGIFAERYGIDISLDMLNIAKQRNGIEVCMGRVENLPYKDNVFDMIICTDVLEHVQDLYHTVLEINRVLKRGGVLIIRVPYKEDLRLYVQKGYPYKYAHLRNFDDEEIEILFTKIANMVLCKRKAGEIRVGREHYNLINTYGFSNRIAKEIHSFLQRKYPALQDNRKYLNKFYLPYVMNYVYRKL